MERSRKLKLRRIYKLAEKIDSLKHDYINMRGCKYKAQSALKAIYGEHYSSKEILAALHMLKVIKEN